MNDEELQEYLNKFPDALQALTNLLLRLNFHVTVSTNYLLRKGLYDEFCNELNNIMESHKETIQ